MKKMKYILLMLFMLLFVGGCGNGECNCPADGTNTNQTVTTVVSDYSELYKQTAQSVVMVRVQRKSNYAKVATGSGVVVYEDDSGAYIYTNAHVLKNYDTDCQIEIIFSDDNGVVTGSSEIVTKVYKDEYQDVAVLKINKSNKYKVAKLGNSDELSKGSWVYTIGSPLEKFNYTTSGNITGINVETPISIANGALVRNIYVLVFDCPISNGNSGGALFNSKGELVGITTLKDGDWYGAIPINFFDKVGKYLISNHGVYPVPYLNITLKSIPELGASKSKYGISQYVTSGVYIESSSESFIVQGLIIQEINGKAVNSSSEF